MNKNFDLNHFDNIFDSVLDSHNSGQDSGPLLQDDGLLSLAGGGEVFAHAQVVGEQGLDVLVGPRHLLREPIVWTEQPDTLTPNLSSIL